jgi:hypothetical protein
MGTIAGFFVVALAFGCGPLPNTPRRFATPHDVMVTFESGITVREMSVDGNVVVPPPPCSPRPTGPLAALCSPAFQHLAHDRGPRAPRLIDTITNDADTYYVFAAVFDGSGECGAYGLWVMRVHGSTLQITPPLEGCFVFSYDDAGLVEAGTRSPDVHQGPPLRLVVEETNKKPRSYVLDERTFALVPQ